MASILKISQATSLALHTMVFLAERPDAQVSTREIAATLRRSEYHLAKVLQRLTRAGLVRSVRGPKGGFRLLDGWEGITLLQIYEAMEGPLLPGNCISGEPVCTRVKCIMGGLTRMVNRQVMDYLNKTSLGGLSGVRLS